MAARSLFARTSFPLCFGLGAGFQLVSSTTAPITTIPAMYTPYTTYGHLPLSTVVSESSQCPLLLRFRSKPRFFNYIPDRNNDFPSMARGNESSRRIGDTAFRYVYCLLVLIARLKIADFFSFSHRVITVFVKLRLFYFIRVSLSFTLI